MPHCISVYLADDHEIVLKGIASVIESDPELSVVGCTTDSKQIIEDLMHLHPQVLVLDLAMPDIPGIEIMRAVKARRTLQTRIVVFTMHKNIGYVVEAFAEGAKGFVVKDADSTHLLNAIKAVARGKHYLSPPFTERQIREYRRRLLDKNESRDLLQPLSRRERELFLFVAQGFSNKEIADKLGIAVRTVETHRFNMMRKTGFKDKLDLIQWAMQHGYVSPVEDEDA